MDEQDTFAPANGAEAGMDEMQSFAEPRPGRRGRALGFIIVVIIIIAGVWWWRANSFSSFKNDWQAVFLTNGQVYFGKVAKQNRKELALSDIYYLQVVGQLQQGAAKDEKKDKGELSLVKLGNELHGPTDMMYINRDQVLFVEDLKDEGQVAQAIKNYKGKQ